MLGEKDYDEYWEAKLNWYLDAGFEQQPVTSTPEDLEDIEGFVRRHFPNLI